MNCFFNCKIPQCRKMEYNAKKRKFMLAEQEKIGNALKAKKTKYEADKNDPSINKSV